MGVIFLKTGENKFNTPEECSSRGRPCAYLNPQKVSCKDRYLWETLMQSDQMCVSGKKKTVPKDSPK